jgi:hypothetical protein
MPREKEIARGCADERLPLECADGALIAGRTATVDDRGRVCSARGPGAVRGRNAGLPEGGAVRVRCASHAWLSAELLLAALFPDASVREAIRGPKMERPAMTAEKGDRHSAAQQILVKQQRKSTRP